MLSTERRQVRRKRPSGLLGIMHPCVSSLLLHNMVGPQQVSHTLTRSSGELIDCMHQCHDQGDCFR